MTAEETLSGGSKSPSGKTPPLPSTSAEFINTLAHYHRAEILRMAGWRDRIDRTSNWAITVVAAMISLSLSTPEGHHGVLLFGMLLVLLLLWIEARRYRFFDVYRARVRLLERHYFAEIFAPAPDADPDWARILGEDLRRPLFLITVSAAMARRLRRNYIWMFLILLLAWMLKISSARLPAQMEDGSVMQPIIDVISNAALGPLPGWTVIIAVAAFYSWLVFATLRARKRPGELAYGDVHV
jgi:uncharacterized membrane protein